MAGWEEHISTVLLSHLDADHIGGVVAGEPDRFGRIERGRDGTPVWVDVA